MLGFNISHVADYCHKMGIVNRDIKLENTLLSGGESQTLKLIDFGYAKTDSHSLPKSVVGTKGYTGKSYFSVFFLVSAFTVGLLRHLQIT